MKKYSLLAFMIVLSGCATAKLDLADLPSPVFINETDGTTYMQPSSETRPANALAYSQIDTMVKGNNYGSDRKFASRNLNCSTYYDPYIKREHNNIVFLPNGTTGSSYYEITYRGDSFVPNANGFAEQTTGEIPKA